MDLEPGFFWVRADQQEFGASVTSLDGWTVAYSTGDGAWRFNGLRDFYFDAVIEVGPRVTR